MTTRVLRKIISNPFDVIRGIPRLITLLGLAFRNRVGRGRITSSGGGPVISMTSYGSRLATVYLVIESIARGRIRPSRLILWVDDKDIYIDPPRSIRRLKVRGLEVRLTENMGPHKKYYPFLQSEDEFREPLITADDDVLYPKSWAEGLMREYQNAPDQVHCYRAHVMEIDQNGLVPYRHWKPCRSTEPSFRHFATGVSGILYPPKLLNLIKNAGDGFKQSCPKADDVWLHVQAIRAGYMIHQVHPEPAHFPPLPGTQATSLYKSNVVEGDGNDHQARSTYTKCDLQRITDSCQIEV